jgi:hypothetical protein
MKGPREARRRPCHGTYIFVSIFVISDEIVRRWRRPRFPLQRPARR